MRGEGKITLQMASGRIAKLPSLMMNRSKEYNYALEGLRGLAAMWVFFAHAFSWQLFDPVYRLSYPWPEYLISFTSPAHIGVLIFICLSGYVIGLTNPANKPLSPKQYLFKRFIRIYPLYLLTVVISSLIAGYTHLSQIFGHLIFLNPHFVAPLAGNNVLWSIGYEVIYYLVFLLIALFLPHKRTIFIYLILSLSILVCLVCLYPGQGKILASYLSGLVFWLLGMYLSWFCVPKPQFHNIETEEFLQNRIPLWSMLLLVVATGAYGNGGSILNGLHLSSTITSPLGLNDFFCIPIVIYIFLALTQNTVSKLFKKLCFVVSFLLPSTFITIASFQGKLLNYPTYLATLILLVLAVFLLPVKTTLQPLENLKWSGSVSYAIYIFHIPVMVLIGKIPNFSNTLWEFLLRLCLSLAATLAVANFAETKLQPSIRHHIQLLIAGIIKNG
ncbi:acyltransferase family protein [Nostoc sp. 'Peltigera membranacea cyanobiont' 213]|uniref:acyltransferase family protein n=1 Tax=Nostoc sp. 'Peltigera membranacea cyanobiont' 213 TaxID=2014530 RepID=UPI00167DF4C7|nr:acyltransferase [Nostoc sp. 'Peltigera membranacea cyanobiont' 213]